MELYIPMLFIGMDNGTNYMELYIPMFFIGMDNEQIKYNNEFYIPTLSFEMDNSL